MHNLLPGGLTQEDIFDAAGMRRRRQLTALRLAQYG